MVRGDPHLGHSGACGFGSVGGGGGGGEAAASSASIRDTRGDIASDIREDITSISGAVSGASDGGLSRAAWAADRIHSLKDKPEAFAASVNSRFSSGDNLRGVWILVMVSPRYQRDITMISA